MFEDENYEKVLKLLKEERRCFLTGPAGTGKTFLVNRIKKNFDNSILLGSTGISASLIDGQTIHSFFKLGYAKNIQELLALDRNNIKKYRNYFNKFEKTLKSSDLIIIDEVSMLTSEILDMIHYRLEMFDCYDIPLLLVGDLLQLPPVNSKSYIFYNEKFDEFPIVKLDKVFRTKDEKFIKTLNNIRIGKLTNEDLDIIKNCERNLTVKDAMNITQLYATRNEVDYINNYFLNLLNEELHVFKTNVEILVNVYNKEKEIENFFNNSRLPDVLKIKKGARVMILKNNLENGYANGDIGTVYDINNDYIVVYFERIGKKHVYKEEFMSSRFITKGSRIVKEDILIAKQFPLCLAFASTIHKSQGLTLENVYINCAKIFEKSQFYVALSRAVNLEGVYLKNFNPDIIQVNPEILNFYNNI